MTTATYDFRALVEGLEVTHPVRVVTRAGAPWFCANDVCVALGTYRKATGKMNVSSATLFLDSGDKGTERFGTPGGFQPFTVISEAGLNLMLMRSDSPSARPFQDWLAREVLPSIRKTGSYALGAGETMPLPTSFAHALRQHAETLVRLAEEQEAHAATEAARRAAQEAKAQAEAELARVMPAATVGQRTASYRHSLFQVCRKMLPGVYSTRVKEGLTALGYFYRVGGTHRVYAKHLELFAERFVEEHGRADIFPTLAGRALLIRLYEAGDLPMKKGRNPSKVTVEA